MTTSYGNSYVTDYDPTKQVFSRLYQGNIMLEQPSRGDFVWHTVYLAWADRTNGHYSIEMISPDGDDCERLPLWLTVA